MGWHETKYIEDVPSEHGCYLLAIRDSDCIFSYVVDKFDDNGWDRSHKRENILGWFKIDSYSGDTKARKYKDQHTCKDCQNYEICFSMFKKNVLNFSRSYEEIFDSENFYRDVEGKTCKLFKKTSIDKNS